MSLSIFTSASSMSSTNAMNKANNLLSTAMERLALVNVLTPQLTMLPVCRLQPVCRARPTV